MATTQPIRDINQARELANYYLQRGAIRNHVLIVMGIHTALRISDVLSLKWEEENFCGIAGDGICAT
ncbi:hypothetical protein AGMMS49957_18160 [Synergistales bacterium]|nr:hypothetical protein AGMMS49957_18160 [Synergistales bacterium]